MLGLTEDRQFVVVRVDLMRQALTAFQTVAQKHSHKRGWSQLAEGAVYAAVGAADRENRWSYLKCCYAFRKMVNKSFPRTLQKFVSTDGIIADAVIDAVALTPLRMGGKFRIKEFTATVEKLASEFNS